MKPTTHLFLGLIFSLLSYLIFEISLLEFLILFLSTWFFIDLDIVFIFIIKKRSLNPFRFYSWAKNQKDFIIKSKKERKKIHYYFRFFHSFELILLLLIFSFFNKFLFFVIIGFVFHLILDWIDLYNLNLDIFHKVSWFYYLKKNKNTKKQ